MIATGDIAADASGTVPALTAHGLSHRFGRAVLAVDGVDLRVGAGEVFGLVGADGAGKSTLIRMLATVLAPTDGDAEVFGHSVRNDARAVKARIGYMSQRFSLYGDLTVNENLAFFARLRGVPAREIPSRSTRLLEFAGLTEFSKRQAGLLSGGMKQKLALAVTLIHEPDLLYLDEPTTGVDPVSRREFWRIIAGLHQRGITVFVATPYMDEAERCSTVAFMDSGRILFSDTPAGLKRRVPGSVYEVHTTDQRAAVRALGGRDWVLASTVYGDVARVIVAAGGPSPREVHDEISSAGVVVSEVVPGRMDMEATFAFLAEETRRNREVVS
ncbi:MAG: ABC transporter ATP-binding protein [Coriobacteriia bacterium]